MEPKPLISIIIPTYNRGPILKEAIESAINQTYENKQIIVVDDGSQDETAAIVRTYPEVQYIYQENKGQANARNKGLEVAQGTFIASLDSDDFWDSSFLSCCIQKLEEDKLDFVFTNWHQQDSSGSWKNYFENFPFLAPYSHRENNYWVTLTYENLRDLYLRCCPSPSSSVVMRRSSIVSGWNEQMTIGDDWCLLIDMVVAKECKVAYCTRQLWHKRIDGTNIYNGRNPVELLKLLNIADTGILIDRYSAQLTKSELRILQERYFETLYMLGKYFIFQKPDLQEFSGIMKRIVRNRPRFLMEKLAEMMSKDVRRHGRNIMNRLGKANPAITG